MYTFIDILTNLVHQGQMISCSYLKRFASERIILKVPKLQNTILGENNKQPAKTKKSC